MFKCLICRPCTFVLSIFLFLFFALLMFKCLICRLALSYLYFCIFVFRFFVFLYICMFVIFAFDVKMFDIQASIFVFCNFVFWIFVYNLFFCILYFPPLMFKCLVCRLALFNWFPHSLSLEIRSSDVFHKMIMVFIYVKKHIMSFRQDSCLLGNIFISVSCILLIWNFYKTRLHSFQVSSIFNLVCQLRNPNICERFFLLPPPV